MNTNKNKDTKQQGKKQTDTAQKQLSLLTGHIRRG